MNLQDRDQRNERFLQRLLARRPQDRVHYETLLKQPLNESTLEAGGASGQGRRKTLETIVSRERPVLFVKDGAFEKNEVTLLGAEAKELVRSLEQAEGKLSRLMPLIGRFDVVNFPGADFVGTGWFVDHDIVVTNRHVASLIARWDGRQFVFNRGIGGLPIEVSLCNAHEFDDPTPDEMSVFKAVEVLYIEPDSGPNDIAFVRVARRTSGTTPPFITLAPQDAADEQQVCVVGYPARAPQRVIPDQDLMQELFRGRYDVKRAAPGFSLGVKNGTGEHDCTTLGGNSGSVVLDLQGRAVGLHFAGLYLEANYTVPVSILSQYVTGKRWNDAINLRDVTVGDQSAKTPAASKTVDHVRQQAPANSATSPAAVAASLTFTIPLTIRVDVGVPQIGTGVVGAAGSADAGSSRGGLATGSPVIESAAVSRALAEYWKQRPEGVLAARVGFLDNGGQIGDQPCIAASVAPRLWGRFEADGTREFAGIPVRYFPAEVGEQLDALPSVEAIDSIAYDDNARTSAEFSFAPVNEELELTLHVGPEYSWEVLQKFLQQTQHRLVSGIYEFDARHIREALEERLKRDVSLRMVLDNMSFPKVMDDPQEFNRVEVFRDWAKRFKFERIIAPEGRAGLIANAYHIKVTVRDDDTFWLSSGNWKKGSSQPLITQAQRDNATQKDLPGNREWHVIVKNRTLADRFRAHLLQDFKRSTDLGGAVVPKSFREETFVDVPMQEAVELERPAPSRILEPKTLRVRARVRMLLTPDHQGEVYSEAVLALIRSARKSLLFQIPYIAMPNQPGVDRGFIDDLIGALTDKLKTLPDARVILRTGSKEFSSPQHAAFFFKDQGVDIARRLRVIENHHTKGMIVDGRRLLLGSHNWSGPGVTLNRDASLLIDSPEAAAYYSDGPRAAGISRLVFGPPSAMRLRSRRARVD